MPLRMKKNPLRRRLLRRRPIRRRFTRPSKSVHQVHNYKRTVYIPQWVQGSTVGDVAFKFEPTLSDLATASEFTALYDQYMVTGITFRLIPRFNTAEYQPANQLPSQIMSVCDYDGNGPTTIAALVQYQNIKTTRGTAAHQRFFKPAVLAAAYQGLTPAYMPKWNQWVDTGNPSTPHYGLYGIIPQCSGAQATYDLQATYYVKFKQVR